MNYIGYLSALRYVDCKILFDVNLFPMSYYGRQQHQGADILKIIGVKLHNRTGGPTDFVEFRLADVNYIDLWRPTNHSAKVPAYHTPDGSYLALSSIKDLAAGYNCLGFKRYGGSTVVNEKRVGDKIIENCGTTIIFLCGNRVQVQKKG